MQSFFCGSNKISLNPICDSFSIAPGYIRKFSYRYGTITCNFSIAIYINNMPFCILRVNVIF